MTVKTKKRKPSRASLKRKADRLFSLKVRERGYCELLGRDDVKCRGALQCAHIIGRRYHSVRWDEENALCLCQGHHWYYTVRPEAWFLVFDEPGHYAGLYAKAQRPWDRDIGAILERLNDRER